ncbi:MAG TPA: two-component regulator propeller domain-containing protein [Verrucomicrobiae bacterium]|nr:two-component regulator propeller domain-containing protein [Verrucomicrobiae bacterium]
MDALLNWRMLIGVMWIFYCTIAETKPVETLSQSPPKFVIKAWTMSDGLPHLSVTALAQTRDGYIWIGTLAGLACFDGVNFKVFTPQNCSELPKSRIGGLFEGADGTLFIATDRGGGLVALRDGKFEQLLNAGNEEDGIVACLKERSGDSLFVAQSGALWRWSGTNLTAISTNRDFYPILPRDVCEDEQGRVWMVGQVEETGRLLRFSSGRLEPVVLKGALAEGQVYALAQDKQGQIWLGTSQGLAILRGDQFEPIALPGLGNRAEIRDLAACRDGGLWVCSTNYWYRKYKVGHWVGPASEVSGVKTSLKILCEDRWGNLCLGHYPEGLVRISPNGDVSRIERQDGLPGSIVDCYLTDHEGNEWLGLFDGGLVRLQPEHFNVLGGSALTTPVYSICEDHKGAIWVGTSYDGIYRFQGANTIRYGASDIPLTDVWSLFEDSKSNLWVGTSSYGVYQFRGGRFVQMFDRLQISDRVNVIYEDHQNRIWFGCLNGLAYYENGKLTKASMPWLSDEYEVVAITEDKRNRIWIGTKGAGLFCLDKGHFVSYTTTNGLLSNLIWSLYVDADDTLWIGSADGGLSRLRDGKFANFTPSDGLADNTICHITEDSNGRLWFSSPHGVFYVEKKDLESFARGEAKNFSCTSFDQSDGMPSSSCTCAFQPSGWMTKNGSLLFPTLKGVVIVRPDEVDANALPPPVYIEEVIVDGQVQNPQPVVHSRTEIATLTVPPGKGRLEIRYTALSFSAPEKVRFKYWMKGLDSDWVDGGTKRVADYPYLPHGRYQFQVLACNNDGVWNTQGASLEITILSHFWQTWWFIVAATLIGGAGVAFTVRRIEKVKMHRRFERQEQTHAVELERARIARDFHDDIGACLTHMMVLSELVKEDKDLPMEVEGHAKKIANTAQKAVRGLGTIIWAVNPRNDTLDSFIQYISQYSYDFFQPTQIICHLDFPTEVPLISLTAEVRHNLFMVVTEALNNILKHSRASEVHLRLILQGRTLEICVEDNGCGFDTAIAFISEGNGLINMRHRIEMIGALLHVESRPGKGTTIRVQLNYSPEI